MSVSMSVRRIGGESATSLLLASKASKPHPFFRYPEFEPLGTWDMIRYHYDTISFLHRSVLLLGMVKSNIHGWGMVLCIRDDCSIGICDPIGGAAIRGKNSTVWGPFEERIVPRITISNTASSCILLGDNALGSARCDHGSLETV
jgi:hypothetical protein